MLDLSKIFVTVGSEFCSSFRSKYVNPAEGTERLTNYDSKIVFLEDKQEIFAKGKLYGLNNSADVTALETLIGTMPKKADNSEYSSIVEYIQAVAAGEASDAASLSEDVIMAGGPLADDAIDNWPSDWVDTAGNKYFPAGLSFEDFVKKMFLQEKYGTLSGPVYSWSPSQSKPTVTISKSGSVPVGTEVTLTVTANENVSGKAASAKVSGATYGYSLNGTSKLSDNTSYTKNSTDGTVSGTNSITSISDAWNGYKPTPADGEAQKYYVKNGTNTLSATQTGLSITPGEFTKQDVYSMTNVKTVKTSEKKTINESGFEASTAYAASKDLGSSNSATVKGYYPVYYGPITIVSGNIAVDPKETFTVDFIKALGSDHENIPSSTTVLNTAAGASGYLIAIKGGSQTTLEMLAKSDASPFGASQYFDIDIPMLNDVETVSYRVLYISNASANNNAGEWYMTLS